MSWLPPGRMFAAVVLAGAAMGGLSCHGRPLASSAGPKDGAAEVAGDALSERADGGQDAPRDAARDTGADTRDAGCDAGDARCPDGTMPDLRTCGCAIVIV